MYAHCRNIFIKEIKSSEQIIAGEVGRVNGEKSTDHKKRVQGEFMKLNGKSRLIAIVVVFFANSTLAFANWPDWRGPTGDGRSDTTGLPLKWSETENIVWKTRIHDLGYSTPVVWGDQIWLTTATKDGRTLYAVCVDLNTSRVVHDVEVFNPEKPQRIHRNNSYATPSAVVEQGRVYVHYGTHGTAAIDSQTGKVLWRRTDLNCEHMQGPVSSPVLFEDSSCTSKAQTSSSSPLWTQRRETPSGATIVPRNFTAILNRYISASRITRRCLSRWTARHS